MGMVEKRYAPSNKMKFLRIPAIASIMMGDTNGDEHRRAHRLSRELGVSLPMPRAVFPKGIYHFRSRLHAHRYLLLEMRQPTSDH